MRYLFIHPVFPGQFHKLMEYLAAIPGNEVWHLSREAALPAVPGVRKFQYKYSASTAQLSHPFLDKFNTALHHGDAVCKAVIALRQKGLVPDIICCYAGWGHGVYLKDIYPDTPVVGYFEWFLNTHGAEYNFDPAHPLAFDRQRLLRITNAGALLDLHSFDAGVTPTEWQRRQFPLPFRDKLHCIHDGVDTTLYQPASMPTLLQLPDGTTLNTATDEILTYCTRGMEPFRGFPQFMRALALVQQRRPHCHAVIAGSDHNFYSRQTPDGRSWKETVLSELSGRLDMSRVHFTGFLPQQAYRQLLQASHAHVYLTYPYVLSWSLLEAMSTGCVVIGSNTAPVQEVLRDGDNGHLVGFFDDQQLANTIDAVLAARDSAATARLRQRARQTILDRYSLPQVLPSHVALLDSLLATKART